MAETRSRLGDAEVAALARVSFGLGDAVPELPAADTYEDAQGVLVAVREEGRLVVVEVPRWRSPSEVAVRVEERGWTAPVAWIGHPPADADELPAQVLALVPVVLGSGRPYFGAGGPPEIAFEDPQVVQGSRVTFLVYDVRR